MTKDEIQRFLEMAARDGVGELEASRRLWELLGISGYPRIGNSQEKDRKDQASDR